MGLLINMRRAVGRVLVRETKKDKEREQPEESSAFHENQYKREREFGMDV